MLAPLGSLSLCECVLQPAQHKTTVQCLQPSAVLVVDVAHATGVHKAAITMTAGRDAWYQDVIPLQPAMCNPVWVGC